MANQNDEILRRINRVSKENGLGEISSAIFNTFYGINHRGTGSPVPTNADQHGLTFFTRPNLNLSYDNIKGERIFFPLLDKNPNSFFRAIRLWLDKDATDDFLSGDRYNPIVSNIVNNKSPWISVLTNNLLSMSGWQDLVIDTYSSKEGRAREAWSMGDGIARNYTVTPISASFRNMIGDPITLLFFYWIHYISLVYEGRISPKPESLIENEIDYMTRFYRVILDPTRTFVRKISCCGAAFPTSAPIGASHNFSVDKPINNENDQVSINFQMIGTEYLDPIIIEEFNAVTAMYNPALRNEYKAQMKKIPITELSLFNHRGYPWINPISYELEWYIEQDVYEEYLNTDAEILNVTPSYGLVFTNNPASPDVGYSEQIQASDKISTTPIIQTAGNV